MEEAAGEIPDLYLDAPLVAAEPEGRAHYHTDKDSIVVAALEAFEQGIGRRRWLAKPVHVELAGSCARRS